MRQVIVATQENGRDLLGRLGKVSDWYRQGFGLETLTIFDQRDLGYMSKHIV